MHLLLGVALRSGSDCNHDSEVDLHPAIFAVWPSAPFAQELGRTFRVMVLIRRPNNFVTE